MKITRCIGAWIACLTVIMAQPLSMSAKDLEATVVSDPEGATVYLNGMVVATTTPSIIKLDKKMINKNLLFRFEKAGYESKTVIISLDKKEIKKSPIIYGKLEKDQQAALRAQEAEQARKDRAIRKQDPSIPAGQASARVSRDNAGATSMEKSIIRWYFDSDPRGARVFYRVISNNPAEVKNTNETI